MMDVTVKTLDGQNRNYSIPENMTVRKFKEKIANSINISADVQRLIFQGRVMQDDKPLKEYDIHGKVIHVVERPPPGAAPTRTSTATSSAPSADHGDINSIVVGSFTHSSDILEPNQVQNVVEQAVSNMGDMGRNARVSTRSSADGSAVDVRIHLAHVPPAQVESEAQLRLNNVRRMLRLARGTLDRLENPQQINGNQESSATDTNGTATTSGSTGSVTPPTAPATPPENNTNTTPDVITSTLMDSTESQPGQSQEQAAHTLTPSPDTPPSSAQGGQPAGSAPTQTGQRRGPNRPRLVALAEVLSEILEVNSRLQPHLERYQCLMADDPELQQNEVQESQRVCNMVTEVLHSLSHCYHSVSDIMADLSQPRPRQLYATLAATVSMPAAIIQQTMPVQAHINVANPNLARGTQPQAPPAPSQNQTQPAPSQNQTQPPTNNVLNTASTQSAPVSTNTQTSGPQRQTTGNGSGAPLLSSQAGTDPYVFVEVGPDSVTVNSISAQYVESDSTPTPPTTAESTNTGTTTSPSAPRPAHPGPIPMQSHGPNLPPTLVQNIVQSMLQAHAGQAGLRPGVPHHFTINGQFPGIMRMPTATGATSTQTQPSPRNSAGTQTQTASSQSVPSDTNTSGTQTRQTPVNTSGTQTQGNRQNPLNNSGTQTQANRQNLLNNSGTQTQGQPRAFVVPGMPGLMGTRPVDPYLPCSSRHFLTQQARNLANHPPTQNSETALADMVTNLMSGLLGQPNPHIQVSSVSTTPPTTSQTTSQASSASTATQQTNPVASVFSGGSFGTSPAGSLPGFGPFPAAFLQSMSGDSGRGGSSEEPQFVNMLRNLLQSGASQADPTPPRPTQPAATQSSEQGAMSDEAFTQLVRGISHYVTQSAVGQAPTETVSDFLNNLNDNFNIVPGEGFLNDLFQCMLSHLTFPDLMQIFFGNSEALNQLQSPLQDFIRERVLQGKQPTPDNIEQCVQKLVQDMDGEIQDVVNEANVQPSIDMVATLKKFAHTQLKALVKLVLGLDRSNTEQSFGGGLYDCVRHCVGELIVLCRSCLTGGMPALETLIQSRLRNMTSGINPMIQQWMLSVTLQQLSSFVPTITVTEESIQHYVVLKTRPTLEGATEASPMEVDAKTPSPEPSVDKVKKTKAVPPKAVVKEVPCSSSSGTAVNGASSTRGATVNGAEPTVKVARDFFSAAAASADEEWQSVIPAEWVPIIAHDIQRQKQQPPQAPFSDSYLQGMPAKRRKIMTQDKSRDLSNAAEVVPELLHQAVAAAGVEPISSVENMTSEASNNVELHSAFDEQISDTLANRLECDSDFRAERFPNSEEYYHKKTNKK